MRTTYLANRPGKRVDQRSARIIMSNEARVLRELRIRSKLSMRAAGEKLGCSDSYISHIENGRTDIPKGERLDRILEIYGGMKQKSFYERVRNLKDEITPFEELHEMLGRLTVDQHKVILQFVQGMAYLP